MNKKTTLNNDIDAELHEEFNKVCADLGGNKYEHIENSLKLYCIFVRFMPKPLSFIIRDRTLDLDQMYSLLKGHIKTGNITDKR